MVLLSGEVLAPAAGELQPPALGFLRWGAADLKGPAGVVGVGQAKGEGAGEVLKTQPAGQHGVGSYTAFQQTGEANEGAGDVIVSCLGGPGAVMVHLPKKQQRHACLTLRQLRRGEIGM